MQDDGQILSVSALTLALKNCLERAFPFVWVRGQVTNLSRPSSGHLYFSLADQDCCLPAVWFKGRHGEGQRFDPLTGEVYDEGPRPSIAQTLKNGQEIVCAGRIGVYGPRGVYQLVVELAQESGLGKLHEEFARLRERLAALGYFAQERKRPLPSNPGRVAVITAPGGAAIQDFLRIAQTRGLSARIRLYPVPVQGEAAPAAIIQAMRRVAEQGWAETVVLIRGGGSLEDLWAFNDEALARAIHDSPIPVLAGIGHEVDFTFADMTADLRAATPTHAAQLLWPERDELYRHWQRLANALGLEHARCLERLAERLGRLALSLELGSPERVLAAWDERLRSGKRLLVNSGRALIERRQTGLETLAVALGAAQQGIPPRAGRLDNLIARLEQAGRLEQDRKERRLAGAREQLDRFPERFFLTAGHALERISLRLEAVNPHAPLERGYALVFKEDGALVRRKADAAPGETLQLVVGDGDIPVRVKEIHR